MTDTVIKLCCRNSPAVLKFGMDTAYFPGYRNSERIFHELDVTLLSVIVRGSCTHLIGDASYEQCGPSIGITPCGVTHCIITGDAGIEVYNLFFDLDKLLLPPLPAELSDILLALFPFSLKADRVARIALESLQCIEALAALHRELVEKPAAYADVIYDYLKLFLVGACRGVLNSGIKISADKEIPGQFRLERVRQKLDSDFRVKITLAELAELAGLNRNYLCRTFRRYAGKTIFAYLLERRVQAAMRQLRQSDEKIIAIAYECGFCDLSHFNRAFKRIAGTAPSAYRKACRGRREKKGETQKAHGENRPILK